MQINITDVHNGSAKQIATWDQVRVTRDGVEDDGFVRSVTLTVNAGDVVTIDVERVERHGNPLDGYNTITDSYAVSADSIRDVVINAIDIGRRDIYSSVNRNQQDAQNDKGIELDFLE